MSGAVRNMRWRFPQLLWLVLAVLGIGLILLVLNDEQGRTLGLENDDFANLLRAGVLLTVLSAGVVAVRGSLGEVLRNIAIWLLILLALMGGYLYRYELQDVASRFSAGLLPGSPLSVTDSEGNVTVTLEKRWNGHFEAQALMDGKPISVMVDTGASTTVLTARDAEAVGIEVDALRFNIPVSTANGSTTAARVRLDTLSIGEIKRLRVPVLVARSGSLDQSLLGMNFMGTLSGYDVRGDRMILRN